MNVHDINDWDHHLITLSTTPNPQDRSEPSRPSSPSLTPPGPTTIGRPTPSANQNEALSALIASLTVISDAAKVQARGRRREQEEAATGDTIQQIARSSDYHPTFHHDDSEQGNDHNNVAPFPVAGYSSQIHTRPKTAGNDTLNWTATRKKSTEASLRGTKSSKALRSASPRTSSLYTHRNDSATSVATSALSIPGKRKRSIFSKSRKDSLTSEREVYGSAISIRSYDEDMEAQRFSAFVRVENIDTKFADYAPPLPTDSKKTLASLNPTQRDDLEDHLIPSRRSSLRHLKRLSSGSRDAKPLLIDEDLIEGDSETIQRIRELQRAREQRHAEWRREAKRSSRSAKRNSLPTPSTPEQHSPVRTSWHAKAVGSAQEEEKQIDAQKALALSSSPSANEILSIPPLFENRTGQPLTPESTASDKRSMSITQRSVAPSLSSAHRHKKKLSDSIKRTTSLRRPPPDDAKAVEEEVEAFLASPRLTQRIRHPRTGRTIAFSEVGDPCGHPVICCVGMGLTRYVMTFYDELAKTHKLRLITPDRPGVGESSLMADSFNTPLGWVDDVAVICSSLGIEKFSLLAHSAGALYALATALKMPQYACGRIHLMAPWIPPSQLALSGPNSHIKPAALPTSHKVLSLLPAAFMKAANSRFFHTTSAASIEPKSKKERRKDRDSVGALALDDSVFQDGASLVPSDLSGFSSHSNSLLTPDATPHGSATPQSRPGGTAAAAPTVSAYQAQSQLHSPPLSPTPPHSSLRLGGSTPPPLPRSQSTSTLKALNPEARQKLHNQLLTSRTWTLATLNANPALDLIICLERRRPIGYRYTDITRPVVIHHGVNDTRVPKENVTWLAAVMKRAELRILDGEGHGLMASANVMAGVLAEIGREWEEYTQVVESMERERKRRESREIEERERELRRGRPKY